MPITLNGDTGITTPTYGGTDTSEYLVPVTAFKNRIINGAMGIWQRGTSGSTSGYCCVDRWLFDNLGTYTRSTDVPAGFQYSLSVAVTTATRYGAIAQRIESANCLDLVGNQVTLSFWIKTTSGSTAMTATLFRANSVDNFGGVTSIQAQSFTSSSSWTKITLTYSSLPALAANGLQVYIFSDDPSVAPTYLITGVQLEKGSTATSFDYRPYGTELALCQRYCYTPIASDNYDAIANGYSASTTSSYWMMPFPVNMRSAPTMSSLTASNFGVQTGTGAAVTITGISMTRSNPSNAWITANVASGLTNGFGVLLIANNQISQRPIFSSEL